MFSSCALSLRRGIVYLMKGRISKTIAWSVVAVGWVGVAWSPTAAAGGQSEAEIVNAFREAHASHQLDRMLLLFCWDHVTPEIRQMTESELSQSLDEELSAVMVTGEHPAGRSNGYIRNGIVYGHNLTVEKELVVESPVVKGDPQKTYFPLGIKDGRYQIALMVPLGPAARPPEAAGQASIDSAPKKGIARERKESGAGTKITIRAMTPLVVRIDQEVGLSLVSSGTGFTATISVPVQVNGVTVIPAGSRFEGTVTKQDHYSPELALTSVTVDGRTIRLRTFPITFNERVSFPAGAEFNFHLMFSLDMVN
jgi:hypothetical protein